MKQLEMCTHELYPCITISILVITLPPIIAITRYAFQFYKTDLLSLWMLTLVVELGVFIKGTEVRPLVMCSRQTS